MEIAFPYAGNLEVLHRPHEGKEVAGVVAVGLVGCVSKYIARSSRIRALQKVPHQLLEFRLKRLHPFVTGFVLHGGFSPF